MQRSCCDGRLVGSFLCSCPQSHFASSTPATDAWISTSILAQSSFASAKTWCGQRIENTQGWQNYILTVFVRICWQGNLHMCSCTWRCIRVWQSPEMHTTSRCRAQMHGQIQSFDVVFKSRQMGLHFHTFQTCTSSNSRAAPITVALKSLPPRPSVVMAPVFWPRPRNPVVEECENAVVGEYGIAVVGECGIAVVGECGNAV